MPPWLPEPGHGEFLGERRLTGDQIRTLREWADQGAAEGRSSDLPTVPTYSSTWQLGVPDLIIRLPEPYTLPAEGRDVFRNFVFSVPVPATRYVRDVEILPGNKKVVHHANLLIDRARAARRRDAQDPGPGFAGMEVEMASERFDPESHFLFWKPGTPPTPGPEDMAWELNGNTDLVLNMHLQPSGRLEIIQPSIGLYFTDRPPSKFPMLLQLEHDGAIDIPSGVTDFAVNDSLMLPLDVDVLGVYPHAHYLGKQIEGTATLPDGSRKRLIRIDNWDLNWQATYQYAQPVFLPAGTILSMRITFDNSTRNVRNPSNPPRRVVAGNQSTDEMGHLWIQVLPRAGAGGRPVLQEAVMRHRLGKYPGEFSSHFNLASILQSGGKLDEAISHYRVALETQPSNAAALNALGTALQASGRENDALKLYRQAVRLEPDHVDARYNIARILLARGALDEAIVHLARILQLRPEEADAHNDLGSAYVFQGKLDAARPHFEAALRLNPGHPLAHCNLGYVLARQGNLAEAAIEYRRALALNPKDADAHNELGNILARMGSVPQAVEHYREALRLDPAHSDARKNLRRFGGGA
jgi:tetratricopeptide (TPR) repeat protein